MTLTAPGRSPELDRLRIVGAGLDVRLAELLLSAELSASVESVTELTLRLADPDGEVWDRGVFRLRAPVDYADLRMRIVTRSLTDDDGGTLELTCHEDVVLRLRDRRGKLVMRDTSPSEFVEREALAAGARGVTAEPSARRKQVARDNRRGDVDEPSSWSTFDRLADELGYVMFIVAGWVYFGRPTWLMAQDTVGVPVDWRDGADGVARHRPEQRPAASDSINDDDRVRVSATLPLSRLDECRPGRKLTLRGMQEFDGGYLLTGLGPVDLANPEAVVDVEAGTPENPEPNPPEKAGAGGAAPGRSSSESMLDFVTVALSQAGDAYIFGAEADPGDADPDAFDCSELVEWAAARVGVTFVDGSMNQWAACQRAGTDITVARGIATRGALLFRTTGYPTHVAISLGNGKTIEAMGRAYGVRHGSAAGRFDAAGIIPGMR